MSPKRQLPNGPLKEQIIRQYGSLDNFFIEFKASALKLKGSGYTFLVTDNLGNLEIINTSNQDTPLSLGLISMFNIDLWEHAYYLNYKNEKDRYIDNFIIIADFANANKIYQDLTYRKTAR